MPPDERLPGISQFKRKGPPDWPMVLEVLRLCHISIHLVCWRMLSRVGRRGGRLAGFPSMRVRNRRLSGLRLDRRYRRDLPCGADALGYSARRYPLCIRSEASRRPRQRQYTVHTATITRLAVIQQKRQNSAVCIWTPARLRLCEPGFADKHALEENVTNTVLLRNPQRNVGKSGCHGVVDRVCSACFLRA